MKRVTDRKDDKCRVAAGNGAASATDLTENEYEAGLARLQVELTRLQRWVTYGGAKICVLIEGRPTAGRRDTIDALTRHASRRVFRVVALPEPTERERSQMYLQRFIPHLPAAGELVIFDGTWYGRAGIDRGMGQCSADEAGMVLQIVPLIEQAIVSSGVLLLKYWLELTQAEQARRLRQRVADRRISCSTVDLTSLGRWFELSRARDAIFAASDTEYAPWFVARCDHDRRARLNVISHLLGRIPYESVPQARVRLPATPDAGGYREPDYSFRYVEERY
jgi:polyphosphate kinase 2 (PPK2 family)